MFFKKSISRRLQSKLKGVSLGLNIGNIGCESNGFTHGFPKSNSGFQKIISSTFAICLVVVGDDLLLLVCFCVLALGPLPRHHGACSCSVVVSRVGGSLGLEAGLGCEVVPLVLRVISAISTYLLWDGEVTHPFREEAAEFIFEADMSHCRAIITVMKEDYAALGL